MPQSRDVVSLQSAGRVSRRAAAWSCALLLAAGGQAASAQSGELAGTVLDQLTRRPVAAATVQLLGTNRSILTDSLGSFRLRTVASGPARVRVQHVAYATGEIDVNIEPADITQVVITISETAVRLDSLSVELVSTNERLRRGAGFGMNVVTRAEIAELEGTGLNLADLLRTKVPAVRVRRRERVAGYPICVELRNVRSISNQCLSPKVILDGVPITSETYVYDNLGIDTIERIEVIPAAEAGARYGTGALWGVLLIDTRKPGGQRATEPQSELGRRARFDWTGDEQGHRTATVLISSAAGNAAGVAAGLAIARTCLRLRAPSNDGIVSDCSLLPTLATGAAAVVLPAVGNSLAARLTGRTDRSRGQFMPATVGAMMAILPGYALALSAKRNDDDTLAYVGYAVVVVGAPAIATLSDYLFRKVRG